MLVDAVQPGEAEKLQPGGGTAQAHRSQSVRETEGTRTAGNANSLVLMLLRMLTSLWGK